MSVLFASDVHLSLRRPGQVDAFVRFLEGPCRAARELFLLGDLFDAWLGDDDHRPPHPRVEQALRRLTDSGVPVRFAFGNHDFLVGDEFARRTGCTLLEQPAPVRVGDERVVVLHGDQLCTHDREYQRWRAYFTDAENQRRFLELPFAERERQAAALRLASAEQTAVKAEDIMDVSEEAVRELLADHASRFVVHGHTHRPGIHRLTCPQGEGLRVVLGDWYQGDTVAVWEANGPRLASAGAL